MGQVTTGVRSILSHPIVYGLFQGLMGARSGRARVVRDRVRPFQGMRILDLGCGPAEILSELPDDVAYVGYDMSPDYIAAARRAFGNRGTFHCRKLEHAELSTLERFDLVMGLGVLHHLDDRTAKQFMELAIGALKSGGRIYTVDPVLVPGQNRFARFLIARDRGQHVRDAGGYLALPVGLNVEVVGESTHQAWIPYTHWHMECTVVRAT